MLSNDFDYRSVVYATLAINSCYLHDVAARVGVVTAEIWTSSPFSVKLSWQQDDL